MRSMQRSVHSACFLGRRSEALHAIAKHRRLTASELVEIARIPERFRQVVVLYLETYEARVSAVYRTLRHKSIALAHFWNYMAEKHPDVKHCSVIFPRHVRDYIPYAVARARSVQRGPGTGEEVPGTAYSWLVELAAHSFPTSAPGQPSPILLLPPLPPARFQ